MKFILSLLTAVAPALVCGFLNDEQASTVTIVQTFTKTHATVVYITEPASSYSPSSLTTCAATVCHEGADKSTPASGILSTIHSTSYGTKTVTAVVVSSGSTMTVLETVGSNITTESLVSCTGDSANSTTPAIAGTITRSVYPTPATNASVSSGPVSGSSPPSNTSLTYHSPPTGWQSQSLCPCGNSTTIIMTTVTASTTNNDSTPIASTQITYSASTSYHPATYTGGPFPSSAGRTVRVPSLLSLVARFLSLSDVAMAAIGNPGMANRATAAVELEGRFYPYPSPLNSGRPPKATPEKRFYPYPSPLNSGLPPHLTAKPRVVRDLRPTMDILSADESPTPILSLRPPPGAPTSGTLVVTSPFPSSSGGLTAETSEISSSFIHTPDTFTPSCSVVLNVTITESVPIPTTVSIILNQPRSSKSMEDAITVYTTLPSSFNVTETLATTTISTYTTDAITTETLSTPPFSGPVMASSTTVTANAATQASLDVLGMLTIVLMWFGQA